MDVRSRAFLDQVLLQFNVYLLAQLRWKAEAYEKTSAKFLLSSLVTAFSDKSIHENTPDRSHKALLC